MIIDAHTHGFSYKSLTDVGDKIRTTEDVAKFRTRYPELSIHKLQTKERPIDIVDQLVHDMDMHGINKAVIQPIPGISSDDVAKAVKKHPSRLVGLFPLGNEYTLPPDKYILKVASIQSQVNRAINKLGLNGMAEVHLGSFAKEPEKISKNLEPLLSILSKYKCPLLVHTGWSQHRGDIELRAANPIYLDDAAAKFPEVKIILAHMGRGMNYFFEPAVAVALRNNNVYLDTADASPNHIRIAVERLGPERVMFGTDWSLTQRFIKEPADIYDSNLSNVYQAVVNKQDRDFVLGKTALEVYNIKSTV